MYTAGWAEIEWDTCRGTSISTGGCRGTRRCTGGCRETRRCIEEFIIVIKTQINRENKKDTGQGKSTFINKIFKIIVCTSYSYYVK